MKQLFKVEGGCLVWNSKRPPVVTKMNALQLSISKWEFIVEWLKKGRQLMNDGGHETCGLCLLYAHPKEKYGPDEICQGCPVRAYTGKPFCAGTPYSNMDLNMDPDALAPKNVDVATAELNFLRALQQGQPRE